ncbi:MAG TPA: hypothetical protein VEP72_00770 [Microbacterium sp.]|nr:hypothetical protein [Microbacterium sp.]
MASRTRRFAAVAGATLVALALTTACTPEPAPTPTPTGFASEEEAFAAAEATYRAYVDALNQVDLSNPATFEPVFELTSGDASNAIRKELSQMHADGWSVSGGTEVDLVQPSSEWPADTVTLAVCADVGSVKLVDASGQSTIGEDRPPIQSLTVEIDTSMTPARVKSITGREGSPACE